MKTFTITILAALFSSCVNSYQVNTTGTDITPDNPIGVVPREQVKPIVTIPFQGNDYDIPVDLEGPINKLEEKINKQK